MGGKEWVHRNKFACWKDNIYSFAKRFHVHCIFYKAMCSLVETLWGLAQGHTVGTRAGWRAKARGALSVPWYVTGSLFYWQKWGIFLVLKGTLQRYISNSFQSGKKIVMFSYLLIKIIVFSLYLVSNLMQLQGFWLRCLLENSGFIEISKLFQGFMKE